MIKFDPNYLRTGKTEWATKKLVYLLQNMGTQNGNFYISYITRRVKPSRYYTTLLFGPMDKFGRSVFYLFGPPDSVYCTSLLNI